MDTSEDSLKNFNSLGTSQQVALCAYWFDLERGLEKKPIVDFVTTFHEKASIFDVPKILACRKSSTEK